MKKVSTTTMVYYTQLLYHTIDFTTRKINRPVTIQDLTKSM